MELSAYAFDRLRTDGALVLHRGRRRTDTESCPPSILLLAPVAEHPSPEALRRLEHEYSLAAELEPGWAARAVALTQDQGRTVLVLEDPGGEPLDRLLGAPIDLALFLRIALGLCAAIGNLHRRGLVHKDIKPAHVLVDEATGRCWLFGFGIATRLPRERQSPEPPESIAGTLAYMAPEQTGRMNRSIDSRSDLYAAGVTLYELLTGSLPFTASEPIEWVHCHIAREPAPPEERRADVPAPVSAIVLKLLAKEAENRYQTAAGLERDLRVCLAAWEAQGSIADFPLGERDTPDRLLIPEKLYGRASEVKLLLDAFDRTVRGGPPELVLVSGYSGIGKSAVVNELHKAIVPPRGLFASGKFDQYKRDIPYSTPAQAFQGLARRLLATSEAELGRWRDALREALGPNGRLMIDLVPELELIIGPQPNVADLPPRDAQKRFQLVFRRFISVFARPEHPLALFFDDLQWLDAATLDFVEDLLTAADVRHLLLIAAYRDSEVTSTHPVMAMLARLRGAAVPLCEVVLAPLSRTHVGQLIGDATRSPPERLHELADLVAEKTGGNPFFVIQFLTSLEADGLVRFDAGELAWFVDVAGARAKQYTDNIVALMVTKLERLSADAQAAATLASCVGNVFAADTLAVLRRRSEAQTHDDLFELVREGLLDRDGASYRFSHDRVQEAAYSLIPEGSRAEAHLRIGRLLLLHTPAEKREETIFEIVNQLNRGTALITERGERDELAELNLMAGRRARASTAYVSALKYLVAGAALLADDGWERRPELIFRLELHRGECEFLTGALVEAEERLVALSARARDVVERSSVTCLRVDLHTHAGAVDRAVAVGLEYLRQAGFDCAEHPADEDICREYSRVWSRLGSRSVEELFDLPLMTHPASLATMDVLTRIVPISSFLDRNLSDLAACMAVNLSLERGNSDGSCAQYQWFGLLAGARFGDYRQGARFGQLGHDLSERRGLRRFHARTVVIFGSFVAPWTRHIRACTEVIRRGFELANRTGDLTFAAFGCANVVTNLLAAGAPLDEVQREAEQGLAYAAKIRFGFVIDLINAQLGLVRTLRGSTRRFGSFDDGHFDELANERHLSSSADLALAESWYWVRKLEARFFAGDMAAALDAGSRVDPVLWAANLHFEKAEYHFFAALCRSIACDGAEGSRREEHLRELGAHRRNLQTWAEHCPVNFEDRAALVGAELARVEGQEPDAERLYERAIRSAREHGFVHHEAIAYELAGRFYRARGFEQFAQLYVRNARDCYLRWGALGKVRQLEELYPELSEAVRSPVRSETIGAPVEHLDLATVVKISQAVSGEIVLPTLIESLLRTAIEHAGAERGLLILPRGGELQIEAEASVRAGAVTVRLHGSAAALPETIVRYAARTLEPVILDDASARGPFSDDDYVRRQHARSILCLPLVKQGRLVALLYLENNLAAGAFTPARIAVLNVLASQAAMSLENGRLYRELQEREAKIRRLVDANIIGVVISDRDARIVEANDAFLEMVRYTRDDLDSGRLHWSELTAPEWRAASEGAAAQARATGASEVFEKEYFRSDGTRVPVLVAAAAIEPSRNQTVAFVLDLTERKRAEDQRERLRQAEADLARISRVTTMGEFSASLAHEIKQPITAAINNARACIRWLTREKPELGEARESAARMVKDTTRAAQIIDRVGSLYKKDVPRRELVDVNDVARETMAMLRTEAQRYSIAMRADLAADLPTVEADRVQLQQVFMNLVLNGIEAMKDAPGGELTVTSRRGTGGELLITVTDEGVGLPPGNADEVFKAFFTTKPQGTGMGLTISRSIVESHDGRLWATAKDGRGTSFHIVLPAAESMQERVPART